LFAIDPPEPPAPPGQATDIRHWRERLLGAILRIGTLVGAIPALVSISRSIGTGDWWNPVVNALVIGFLAVLAHKPGLPYRLRAWSVIAVLFAISVWLLVRVGAVMQIFLLACPMLAALLFSKRTAVKMLLLCTATVVLVGWASNAFLPLSGYESKPLLKWVNFGTNFAFVATLLTLSAAFLLQRLEQSLKQQRAVADTLRKNQTMLREVAAQVPGMVYRVHLTRDGAPSYLYASPGTRQMFGIEPEALMADGTMLRQLWHPDDRDRIQVELQRVRETGAPLETEFRVRLHDGRERWVHASSTAVGSDGDGGSVRNGLMLDITDRKTSEALVWRQANFDALTGLPNRRMLRDRVEQAMGRSRRDGLAMALMLIDLDQFKEVNDTLGHDRGDLLLVEAARRIRGCVRESDTVARMGGDEFTVVISGITKTERVDLIANQIIHSLCEAFVLGSERAFVTASIGITLFPNDALQIEDLLKNADQALYVAKDAGRNCFRYFTPALQAQAQERARLANDLRGALAGGQFRVHYQPIVELGSGRIVKAEALIRWQHPERGMVSPAAFIPIAESTGLIGEIGEWVFRTAARQVLQWRETIDPAFQVSVNRSPVQFRGDGSAREGWGDTLAGLGLPGDAIAAEITEGLLLDASEGVSRQLLALREAGISIALDDFGTGYSSMSYLQKFDIDFLKIDRSFVSSLGRGAAGRPLCKAMIVMAHELGMRVVAEGVETAEQRDWLESAGCDFAQGYLFAKPMPAEDFEAWVARHHEIAAAA